MVTAHVEEFGAQQAHKVAAHKVFRGRFIAKVNANFNALAAAQGRVLVQKFFFGGKLLRVALNPTSSLSPVPDLVRLVRRLLPALVVVLAACAVLTIWIQPQTRWETFADQSLASVGY